ncbi:hypothetical protein [Frankia sp. Cj3]|uniref:hypothetical protein n=1 Tax=Frankia sp. Cj3 TaxID=2880976 RepID=UPI001EF6883A|nr:hypothetical protein [Frankia sp. Cj3]
MTTTTVTPDQLRTLWTGPAVGRIDRGPDLPPVTQDDLATLASGVNTDHDGLPLPDQWEVLADHLNGAKAGSTDGSWRQEEALEEVEKATRAARQAARSLDREAQHQHAAIRTAVACGVPVSRAAQAAGLTAARVYQIRDGRR